MIKYFSDFQGAAHELARIEPMRNAEFAKRFPGILGRRWDGFARMVGFVSGDPLTVYPVTRAIDYKSRPSLHKCDARCMSGKVNGRCECQCRGKNHGAGMFTSLMAA